MALWFILRVIHVLKSSRALCPRVSSSFLALWSPRSGKRDLVCVLLVHVFVCFVRVVLSFFSSSWCRELAAVCDCGTSWTFLLTVFHFADEIRYNELQMITQSENCIVVSVLRRDPYVYSFTV